MLFLYHIDYLFLRYFYYTFGMFCVFKKTCSTKHHITFITMKLYWFLVFAIAPKFRLYKIGNVILILCKLCLYRRIGVFLLTKRAVFLFKCGFAFFTKFVYTTNVYHRVFFGISFGANLARKYKFHWYSDKINKGYFNFLTGHGLNKNWNHYLPDV